MPDESPEIESQGPETPDSGGQPGVYTRVFGIGEFPDQLNRFAWGAFLLPFFWGIANNSWPVMTAWVVGTTSPFLIASMLGVDAEAPVVSTLIAAEVLSEIIAGVARLWAGANAYRLLWRRDAVLNEVGRAPKHGAVGTFLAKQRTWTVVGGIVMAIVAVGSVPLSAEFWREYGLGTVAPAMSLVWLVAEVLLGMWLGRQMRSEGAGGLPDASD